MDLFPGRNYAHKSILSRDEYIHQHDVNLIYRRTLVIFGFWDLQSILGCCVVNLFVPVKFES